MCWELFCKATFMDNCHTVELWLRAICSRGKYKNQQECCKQIKESVEQQNIKDLIHIFLKYGESIVMGMQDLQKESMKWVYVGKEKSFCLKNNNQKKVYISYLKGILLLIVNLFFRSKVLAQISV